MRISVIAILLAMNALVWSWGQNYLAGLGWPSPETHSTRQQTTDPDTTVTHSIAAANATNATSTVDSATQAQADVTQAPTTEAATQTAQIEPLPAPTTADIAAQSAVVSTGLPDRAQDLLVVPGDAPLTNQASFKATAGVFCWRARTWPAESKTSLQSALNTTPADVLWRMVPNELAQRWVLLVAAGNTSLEQRKALLRTNKIAFRDSEAPLPNGLIVATFVARDSALSMLEDLKRKGIPVEVLQERPATPVWEIKVFANNRAQADTLLERVKDVPRYADSPLRVASCDA